MRDFTTHQHTVFEKSKNDVLDYKHRAERFLNGDTISSSTWTAESGLTVDSDSNDTTNATAVISGGTEGSKYKLTNKIVTAAGNTKEAFIYIVITEDEETRDYV